MQEMVRRPFSAEAAAPVMDANQAAIALATAMNEARAELATREDSARSGRTAALDRLMELRRRLAPLYAAIPRDVEGFDLGLVTPQQPRLFVDIIAWVEAGEHGEGWRFLQETRGGRHTLLETDDDSALIGAITRYLARRLVARERALSLEDGEPVAPPSQPGATGTPLQPPQSDAKPELPSVPPVATAEAEEPVAPAAQMREEPRSSWRQTAQRDPAAAASAPAAPAPVAVRRSSGRWLWPLLALVIGLGLGALALYLYARTMAR